MNPPVTDNLPRAVTLLRIVGPVIPATRSQRLCWLAVATACALPLTLALLLDPDPRGLGTHQQIGELLGAGRLPPCSWPLICGLPCPTCGMTTAFANTVRGRFTSAFVAHPGGMVLCLLSMTGLGYGVYVAASGRRVWIHWDRIGVRLMLGFGLLILLGWGFKMAHGLLTGSLPMN